MKVDVAAALDAAADALYEATPYLTHVDPLRERTLDAGAAARRAANQAREELGGRIVARVQRLGIFLPRRALEQSLATRDARRGVSSVHDAQGVRAFGSLARGFGSAATSRAVLSTSAAAVAASTVRDACATEAAAAS